MQLFKDINTFLIVLGFAAIIIEMIIGAATGFELFVLGVIFIIGGIVGTQTSVQFAFATIIVLSAIYLWVGRRMIKQSLHITTHLTNTDSLMGKTAVVVADIDADAAGQVKLEGEVWRASADTKLKKGDKVTIVSVSGVTLQVKPV